MHKRSPAYAIGLLASSLGVIATLATASSFAADAHHTIVPREAVKWGTAPPSLPPGAQASVLLGDPRQPGPFVLRLKFPGGFVVPPHRHSKDEFVTVIAGTFAIGTGEKIEPWSMKPIAAAGFVHLPAGMPHYARAEGETVVQINGTGPFDVVYVDPGDDPRRQ